jgi:antitoxin HicB
MKQMGKRRDMEYFLSKPYKIEITPASEGDFVVSIPDLPGCISQGETMEEALKMVDDAKKAWIETALEDGIEIPEPTPAEEAYSGKFNLRIPRSLHRDLARRADDEKVSLNTLATYLLSSSMGKKISVK